jgi:hypothetical protein
MTPAGLFFFTVFLGIKDFLYACANILLFGNQRYFLCAPSSTIRSLTTLLYPFFLLALPSESTPAVVLLGWQNPFTLIVGQPSVSKSCFRLYIWLGTLVYSTSHPSPPCTLTFSPPAQASPAPPSTPSAAFPDLRWCVLPHAS